MGDVDIPLGHQRRGSRCTEPGAARSSTSSPTRSTRSSLNGRPLDPARCTTARASPWTTWRTENELRVVAQLPLHAHGRGAAPLRRPGRQVASTSTRSSRWPTRAGCSPCSSSPTSRRPSPSPSRRRTTGRSSRTSRRPSPSGSDSGKRRPGAFAAYASGSRRTSRRWSPGPTTGSTASTATATAVDPAGALLPRLAGQHLDADVILEETRQGFAFFERAFGTPYPFAKYDQLFVPEFNSGAMENAGCVTINEDYVFRSRVPEVSYERRARDDPARAGAHVVRRPGHDDVVGRPVAQRVVRRVGAARWRRPRRPGGHRPGRRSPTPTRPGPTGRTSCRRRTRSPPRSTTSRTSRSTSTASPTPRARRCSSSWPPGSAATQFFAGIRAVLPAPTRGATRRWPTCSASSRRPPVATSRRGRPSGSRPPASTRCAPSSSVDDEGRFTSFAVVQTAPDAWPTLRSHRLGDRALRPHRRGTGPPRPRRDRRRGRAHRGARARRRRAARPAAAQRRRPDLREDPARRAVARDPDRVASATFRDRCPGRCAGPRPGT